MVAKVSKLQKGVELQKRLNRKKFPGVSENCARCENHRTLLRLENANQNQLNFIDKVVSRIFLGNLTKSL